MRVPLLTLTLSLLAVGGLAVSGLAVSGLAQQTPVEVTFPSDGLQLHGFLWKPEGNGPFRAIVWNHGSEKMPGSHPDLARFYTGHNYVFFVPHRRGQGRSPGIYIQDVVESAPPASRGSTMIQLQEEEVDDVVAATQFLRSQPFVDKDEIAISGCSFGGIQTLLTGERELNVKALVPFAPGAMSWDRNFELHGRLWSAIDHAKAPIFLLQAENDYSLGPSHTLTKQAEKKHKDYVGKIYPAFGSGPHDGHWKFCTEGMDVWGSDVLAFLDAHMKGGN